jgi:hypothetical protein
MSADNPMRGKALAALEAEGVPPKAAEKVLDNIDLAIEKAIVSARYQILRDIVKAKDDGVWTRCTGEEAALAISLSIITSLPGGLDMMPKDMRRQVEAAIGKQTRPSDPTVN